MTHRAGYVLRRGYVLGRSRLATSGQDLLSYPEGIRARTTHSHMAA